MPEISYNDLPILVTDEAKHSNNISHKEYNDTGLTDKGQQNDGREDEEIVAIGKISKLGTDWDTPKHNLDGILRTAKMYTLLVNQKVIPQTFYRIKIG